jgi:glutaconate CoA-transferase subunit A
VVAYGGPEVGMLCAAGKVKKLIFGFATLDAIPLEPWYRKIRESGSLELMELDEGMFQWGLRAAGMRLPFLPTRCGLATDVTRHNPDIKTIQSPYADGELLLAMPALKLDAAILHVNVADRLGNTLVTGPDPTSTTSSRGLPTPATCPPSGSRNALSSTPPRPASTPSSATW